LPVLFIPSDGLLIECIQLLGSLNTSFDNKKVIKLLDAMDDITKMITIIEDMSIAFNKGRNEILKRLFLFQERARLIIEKDNFTLTNLETKDCHLTRNNDLFSFVMSLKPDSIKDNVILGGNFRVEMLATKSKFVFKPNDIAAFKDEECLLKGGEITIALKESIIPLIRRTIN
jgi:hypothetical protein